MAGLLDFLADPVERRQIGANALAATTRGIVAGGLGAPVDMLHTLANLGIAGVGYLGNKAGLIPSDKLPALLPEPVGGSEWIGRQMQKGGLLGGYRNPNAELIAGGLLAPAATVAVQARAPQIAAGLLKMQENAAKPRTLSNQQGAIVWHGSPHKFDKFDSSKIGTGEGAQAYGHGIYFADNPTVAKTYQGKVSAMQGGSPTINGKPIDWDNPLHGAAFELWRHNGNREAAAAFHEKTFKSSSVPKIIRSGAELPAIDPPGSLYKVDLPDSVIARMLDWDKPLSQQPQNVQQAFQTLKPSASPAQIAAARTQYEAAHNAYMSRPVSMNPDAEAALEKAVSASYSAWQEAKGLNNASGSLAYWGLGKSGRKTSDILRAHGIPGIRYLDGGSRGTGQGTSNFVVFPGEEAILKILERNGAPL